MLLQESDLRSSTGLVQKKREKQESVVIPEDVALGAEGRELFALSEQQYWLGGKSPEKRWLPVTSLWPSSA